MLLKYNENMFIVSTVFIKKMFFAYKQTHTVKPVFKGQKCFYFTEVIYNKSRKKTYQNVLNHWMISRSLLVSNKNTFRKLQSAL